jgi:hypothetical protein
MPSIDLSKLPLVENEKLVDDKGAPLQEALIFEDRIECHPQIAWKVEEGLAFLCNPDTIPRMAVEEISQAVCRDLCGRPNPFEGGQHGRSNRDIDAG